MACVDQRGMQGKKELLEDDLESTRESGYAFPSATTRIWIRHHAQRYRGDQRPEGIPRASEEQQLALFNEYYSVETGLKLRRVETQASEEAPWK